MMNIDLSTHKMLVFALYVLGSDLTYANWYNSSSSTERNDWQPKNISNRCMLMDPSLNYQWTDANCLSENPYLCQRCEDRLFLSLLLGIQLNGSFELFGSRHTSQADAHRLCKRKLRLSKSEV